MILSMFGVIVLACCQDLPVRTSNIDRGLYVLSQYGLSEEMGADTLFLAKKGVAGNEKLLKIPALRFDRHLPDKVFVVEDRVVILVSSGAGRYFHYFVRQGRRGYFLESWPSGSTDNYSGSSNVVALGGNLLGCVWVSPDSSSVLSGNYLYVFSPNQLKFGRLPGKEEGFEIFKGRKNAEFELMRWKVNKSGAKRSVHKIPFWMKDGNWLLSFPSKR